MPALIALLFRWTIPESGRYTCDIKRDSWRALVDTVHGTTGWLSRSHSDSDRHAKTDVELGEVEGGDCNGDPAVATDRRDFGVNQTHQHEAEVSADLSGMATKSSVPSRRDSTAEHLDRRQDSVQANHLPVTDGHQTIVQPAAAPTVEHRKSADLLQSSAAAPDHVPGLDDEDFVWTQWSWAEWNKYFLTEGNWRHLFGVSACWFFLDVGILAIRPLSRLTFLFSMCFMDLVCHEPLSLCISIH